MLLTLRKTHRRLRIYIVLEGHRLVLIENSGVRFYRKLHSLLFERNTLYSVELIEKSIERVHGPGDTSRACPIYGRIK